MVLHFSHFKCKVKDFKGLKTQFRCHIVFLEFVHGISLPFMHIQKPKTSAALGLGVLRCSLSSAPMPASTPLPYIPVSQNSVLGPLVFMLCSGLRCKYYLHISYICMFCPNVFGLQVYILNISIQ